MWAGNADLYVLRFRRSLMSWLGMVCRGLVLDGKIALSVLWGGIRGGAVTVTVS